MLTRRRPILALLLGLLLGLGADLVLGQPFVVPPAPVNITNAAGTAIADITGTSVNVNCTAGCAAGAAFADNSAFTAGTTAITNIGGVFNDALGAVAAGNAANPRITAQRGLHINLRNTAGTETGTAGTPLRVDPTGTTIQPVSGTVTTTPPANASTNVAQFGGNAVVTGTGVSGLGIPRVTVSNDSVVALAAGAASIGSLAANQSVNVAQFGATNVVTGVGGSGAGIPRVTVANDSTVILGAGAATIGALTANQSVNVAQWIGSATPTVGQKTMAASLPMTLASDQSVLPAVAEQRASTLWVTATAAVNTASTATLPAAGVGLFHYITRIELVKLYSVIGIAAGAGVIVTTTNLPGGPAFTTEQVVGPVGTATKVIDWTPATPIKSSVANTATTFVAPLQLQTIWRWNVTYFTAL